MYSRLITHLPGIDPNFQRDIQVPVPIPSWNFQGLSKCKRQIEPTSPDFLLRENLMWIYSLESITSQPPPQNSLVTLLPCCIYCISLYLYRLLIHMISIHQLFRVILVKNLQVFFHGLKPAVSVFVSPEFPWIHRWTGNRSVPSCDQAVQAHEMSSTSAVA